MCKWANLSIVPAAFAIPHASFVNKIERDRLTGEQRESRSGAIACYIGNMAHLVVKVIERCENATENAQLGKGFAEYIRPTHEYTYVCMYMYVLINRYIYHNRSAICCKLLSFDGIDNYQ